MKYEKILSILNEWKSVMRECGMRMDQLSELTGQVVESPLGKSVDRIMGSYTATVSELIGWDAGALEDWWIEHKFGERQMKIGFPGEELRSISTVEELADFIVEDLRRARPECVRNPVLLAFETHQPRFDEAEFAAMVERGTAAWSGVANLTEWLEDLRGDRT